MADRKISDLTALTAPAAGDYLPIVDISEVSAANKNKRITIEELLRGAPDGTAAAPSIGFESDPNTGIYRPGADQLAISTNGVGRLFVDSSGLVGIGTNAPSSTNGGLDIASGGLSLVLGADGSASTRTNVTNKQARIGAYHYTNAEEPVGVATVFSTASSNAIYFGGGTASVNAATSLEFYTAANTTTTTGTQRMVIDSSGRVGIGTTNPTSALHVNGQTTAYGNGSASLFWGNTTSLGSLTYTGTTAIIQQTTTADGLAFWRGTTEQVRIDTFGRVGIATANPASTLDVNGSIQAGWTASGQQITVANGDTTNRQRLVLSMSGTNAVVNATRTAGTVPNLTFAIDANERARIDSSGRLLVGTSSALTNIYVGATATTPQIQLSGAGLPESSLSLLRTGATGATIFLNAGSSGNNVIDGSIAGRLVFNGYDGTNYRTSAQITAEVDGTPGADDMPGRLVFSTTADGASSPTERMRITSDAYVRLASGTGGIQFNGDTAAANALDDYEEGTFTLTYGASGDATGASIGINNIGAINNCRYTKIGRTVTMTGSVSFANGDGTTWTLGDWVQLSGLPFTLLTTGRSSGSGFMTSNPTTGAMGTFLISGPTSTNLYIECVTGQNAHSTSNPVEFSITGTVL